MTVDHPDVILAQSARVPVNGEIVPPGDKSISHRALILATLAEGDSRITGLLSARDVDATAQACRQLGATIEQNGRECLVTGLGLDGLSGSDEPLDMGNSGTAMRLLAGVLAAQSFDSTLTGDESLQKRPMSRIAVPLREMGAKIVTMDNGCAPITIRGGRKLRGISYKSPVASAQVKSCVLLAGLYASGSTSVIEPSVSRDHTERMLRAFGANEISEASVSGGARLSAVDLEVPADISSAAFYMAAACLVPDSQLLISNTGLNPTRAGLVSALQKMGCDIRITGKRTYGEEPVGDIEVHWNESIHAIELGARDVPAIIDELPILMVVASMAKGVTRIRGAQELRFKESDRIAVMASGLAACGIRVQEHADGIDIEGQPGQKGKGVNSTPDNHSEPVIVDGAGDHRCAMSFCVLAQALGRPVQVHGSAHIDTSFPSFIEDFSSLGATLRRQSETVNV